ncbi:MAG: hypothetical protein U0R52_10075 [Solirubrobacterales bacterium]
MKDVIRHFEDRLAECREQAARAVDRTEALVDLLDLSRGAAGDLGQPYLTPEQLHASPRSERERARLAALIDRATTNRQEEDE